jgi:hypothetical protein
MNSRYLLSVAAAAASFLLTASPVVPAQPALLNPHIAYWLSFDVTGSTYTQASAINDFGEVAGDYADANGIFHSFLRKADGAIVTFDPPGAGSGDNASGVVSVPTGINNRGDIVGYYLDSGAPLPGTHGFVRWANGAFTTFDDPSANSSPVSTAPNAISDAGVIVGSYNDTITGHGFLRERDGSFITIDGPGTVQTSCLDINIEGETVCQSQFALPDGSLSGLGVLRYSNGKTVTYDAPGAAPPFGTSVGCLDSCGGFGGNPALNVEGDVTGYYSDTSGALHGYVRYANGSSFTEFMATGDATFTVPVSINGLRTVVGSYFSPSLPFPILAEAFVRFANGTVVLFNAPEAGQLGTEPFAINSLNEFTGLWFDANFVGHGFVAAAVPW